MDNRKKLITILVCFCLLIFMSGIRMFYAKGGRGTIETADDLSGRPLGGISSRMPDNSAKIFYESMLGRKLSSYTSYAGTDEALCDLRSGKISAIAVCDVTARYLAMVKDGLKILDTSDMAAIENMREPRFSFGFAAKNNDEGRILTEELNQALTIMRSDGCLDMLTERFIDPDTAYYASGDLYKESELNEAMAEVLEHAETYSALYGGYKQGTIRIGVTGGTPPIDMFDNAGRPEGFSAAMAELLSAFLGKNVRFVVSEGETLFTDLMSDRIDLVLAYGAGRITTEGEKNWVMTDGYYPVSKYEFIVLEDEN